MVNTFILYLISTIGDGSEFWKIDMTSMSEPLEKDLIQNFECYRKEYLGEEAAFEIKNAIDLNIFNLIKEFNSDGNIIDSRQGNEYPLDIPLYIMESIFDFWFELYKNKRLWLIGINLLNNRSMFKRSNLYISKALKGDTRMVYENISKFYSYRPYSLKPTPLTYNPMWD